MGVAFLQMDVVFSRLQLDYCRSAQLYSDYSSYNDYSSYRGYCEGDTETRPLLCEDTLRLG